MARLWSIAAIVFWFCFIYTAAVSKNCLRYTYRIIANVANLARFVTYIFIQDIIQAFCVFYLYTLCTTELPWLWDTVSTKNMLCCLKNCLIKPLPPHDGHFLLSPRWPLWRCSTVRRNGKHLNELKNIKRWCTVARVTQLLFGWKELKATVSQTRNVPQNLELPYYLHCISCMYRYAIVPEHSW